MNLIKRILGVSDHKTAESLSAQDEPVVGVHIPLADEVRKTQIDYVRSLMALGRANAHSRHRLAALTLENVHGKRGHV